MLARGWPSLWRLSLATLLVAGCAASADPPEAASTAELTPVSTESVASEANVAVEPVPNAAEAGDTASTPPTDPNATPPATVAADPLLPAEAPIFEPPYKNRLELFQRPNVAEVSGVARAESPGGAVELKGFVNVGGVKAVVTVDGAIAAIGQGEQRLGLEVVEVKPPSVILQRGRTRWTATLFDPNGAR